MILPLRTCIYKTSEVLVHAYVYSLDLFIKSLSSSNALVLFHETV